jgi:hypothetical protein
VASSTQFEGAAEGIVSYLTPGTYSLVLLKYGSYAYHFCQSFYLEVAISPTSLRIPAEQHDFCSGLDAPDLSLMRAVLENEPHLFSYPPTDWSHPHVHRYLDGNYHQVRQTLEPRFRRTYS